MYQNFPASYSIIWLRIRIPWVEIQVCAWAHLTTIVASTIICRLSRTWSIKRFEIIHHWWLLANIAMLQADEGVYSLVYTSASVPTMVFPFKFILCPRPGKIDPPLTITKRHLHPSQWHPQHLYSLSQSHREINGHANSGIVAPARTASYPTTMNRMSRMALWTLSWHRVLAIWSSARRDAVVTSIAYPPNPASEKSCWIRRIS